MSGGDWDPHFDVLHQMADAYEVLRERERQPDPGDYPYVPPPPRDPSLPPLMVWPEHNLNADNECDQCMCKWIADYTPKGPCREMSVRDWEDLQNRIRDDEMRRAR